MANTLPGMESIRVAVACGSARFSGPHRAMSPAPTSTTSCVCASKLRVGKHRTTNSAQQRITIGFFTDTLLLSDLIKLMWRALSLACPCETRQLRAVAGIVCNAKRGRACPDTRRRKVHVDIALRAGGQRTGTIVGLCKVSGVCPANRDAADRECAIACVFQLHALCAAGCAHALIAKREAGRIQSRHRPDTGARKACMLRAAARIVADVQGRGAVTTRSGSEGDGERATGSGRQRSSAIVGLCEVAGVLPGDPDSRYGQWRAAGIRQRKVLRCGGCAQRLIAKRKT